MVTTPSPLEATDSKTHSFSEEPVLLHQEDLAEGVVLLELTTAAPFPIRDHENQIQEHATETLLQASEASRFADRPRKQNQLQLTRQRLGKVGQDLEKEENVQQTTEIFPKNKVLRARQKPQRPLPNDEHTSESLLVEPTFQQRKPNVKVIPDDNSNQSKEQARKQLPTSFDGEQTKNQKKPDKIQQQSSSAESLEETGAMSNRKESNVVVSQTKSRVVSSQLQAKTISFQNQESTETLKEDTSSAEQAQTVTFIQQPGKSLTGSLLELQLKRVKELTRRLQSNQTLGNCQYLPAVSSYICILFFFSILKNKLDLVLSQLVLAHQKVRIILQTRSSQKSI